MNITCKCCDWYYKEHCCNGDSEYCTEPVSEDFSCECGRKECGRMSALWELYEKERSKLSSLPNVDDNFIALGKVYDIVAKSNDDGLKKSWIEDICGINTEMEGEE